MEDQHRRPEDADRSGLAARITSAHDAGRIGTTDRDIRLDNVRSAQSMAELDLMSRDLDQLEAALPAASPVATGAEKPYSRFEPTSTGDGRRTVNVSPRTGRVLIVAIAVVVVLVAGLIFVVGLKATILSGASTGSGDDDAAPAASGVPTSPQVPGRSREARSPAKRPAYSLTVKGINGFLRTYRTWFKTSRVVDLTMYPDYALVRRPLPRSRQEGWLWRDSTGFATFGGVSPTFPGTRPVDTKRLAVPVLVRNIRRARTQLGVERPTTTYLIVRGTTAPGEVVRVDIHVANKFQESAYLSTGLDGTVLRAFPFSR